MLEAFLGAEKRKEFCSFADVDDNVHFTWLSILDGVGKTPGGSNKHPAYDSAAMNITIMI